MECVGVGMEASCDAEATFADEDGTRTASAAASAAGGAAANLALVSPFFPVGDVHGGDERGFAGDVADVRGVGAIDSVGVDFSGVGAE